MVHPPIPVVIGSVRHKSVSVSVSHPLEIIHEMLPRGTACRTSRGTEPVFSFSVTFLFHIIHGFGALKRSTKYRA
jgi:hypothetical protein